MNYLDNIDKVFFICVTEETRRLNTVQWMINLLFGKDKSEIRLTSKNKLLKDCTDILRDKFQTNRYDTALLVENKEYVYNYIYSCAFNHYDLIKSAYYRNFNRIMICEDDFSIPRRFHHVFRNALMNIPDDADLVQMNHYPLTVLMNVCNYNYYSPYDEDVNNYFYKVTNLVDRWYASSKCYILSRKGMERMIYYYENKLLSSDFHFNVMHNPLFADDIKNNILNYYIFKHKNIITEHAFADSIFLSENN